MTCTRICGRLTKYRIEQNYQANHWIELCLLNSYILCLPFVAGLHREAQAQDSSLLGVRNLLFLHKPITERGH